MQIEDAALELTNRFEKKGYVFVKNNLASLNKELNEFIEVMKCIELDSLDGCENPNVCICTFRHKFCRLFMIRKYSNSDDFYYYTPNCKGVIDMMPTNDDIKNDTNKNRFINLFQNEFADRVMDLVGYIDYIIDPQKYSDYIADIIFIADPYNKGSSRTKSNGYGKPFNGESSITNNFNLKDQVNENNNDDRINIGKNKICSLHWHQDQFIETKLKKTYAYDCVALFIVDTKYITPHKLMIGTLKII